MNAMPDNDENDLSAAYYSKGEPSIEIEQNSDLIIQEFKSSNDANSALKHKMLSKISEENTSNEMSTVKSPSQRSSEKKKFSYLSN
tara:strand:+ start:2529 stop:2786 length:258 start_codon:yes stop_codon:yes gene_type:complete